MAAAKKTAKKSSGGALMKWDEELAKYAQEQADGEKAPAGQKVSFRGGVLQIGGSPIKGNSANIIIFDSAYVNSFYEGDFDPDNPSSPTCFAMTKDGENMAPHPDSTEPQHEQCEGCPNNAFGSAEKGKGKACKNGRRIGILSAANLTPESIAEQEACYADIPVTSVKGYAFYVKGLNANFKRPPWAMVTEIAVVPDPKSQFRVTFDSVEPIEDNAVLHAIKARVDTARADNTILFPFAKPAPVVKSTKKTSTAKFAGKNTKRGRG